MRTRIQTIGLTIWLFPALLVATLVVPASAGAQSLAVQQANVQTVAMLPRARASLRERITVTGRLVNLGDFFEGAGDKAATPVAYAPEPGKRAVFDATWLYRVARGYGVAWKPLSDKQQAVVRRESVAIGRAEIEDNLLAAMVDQGISPDMNIELSNRRIQIHVPSEYETTIAVEDLTVDQRSGRFTAWLVAPAIGPIVSRTRVTGQLVRMQNVPVLNARIPRDQVIRADDIKWIEVRSKRIQGDIVTDAEGLVGMTPKRGLRPDTPVQSGDVTRPMLIKRGSLVTMVLKSSFLTLTSQGRALDNGSDGDTIRITNTQSNKTVQAVVTGSGQVRVSGASSLAMN